MYHGITTKGSDVMAQAIFKRIEVKYLITDRQYSALMDRIAAFTEPDRFARTPIYNIYYDTPTNQLIRTSLEKPMYKEKLRLRTYTVPNGETPSFLEIKKKYDGVVYKRRIEMPYEAALSYMEGRAETPDSQIGREISYMKNRYQGLVPAMMICYDRQALVGLENRELRITFDTNIRYTTYASDIRRRIAETPILKPGTRLMEIKVPGAFPLWLVRIMEELEIRQCSFSKYGSAYQMEVRNGKKEKCSDHTCSGTGSQVA